MSMVWRCSSRVLADASSAAARRASVSGSPLRGAVPAIGWARTTVAGAGDEQLGGGPDEPVDRRRGGTPGRRDGGGPSTAPARSGRSAATSTARASTTLRASPARRRRVASATASHHAAGERSARTVVARRPLVAAGQPGIAGEADGGGEASLDRGVDDRGVGLAVGRGDGRDPAGAVVGSTHDDRGHHQLGRRRRVEGRAPSATGPEPGRPDRIVVDRDGAERVGDRVGVGRARSSGPAGSAPRPPRRRARCRSCTNRTPSSPATASRSGSVSSSRVRATSRGHRRARVHQPDFRRVAVISWATPVDSSWRSTSTKSGVAERSASIRSGGREVGDRLRAGSGRRRASESRPPTIGTTLPK